MFFTPRNVGCNRVPVLSDGEWIGDRVREGFHFDTIEELKTVLQEVFGLKIYEEFGIEGRAVINGLLIGFADPD